MKLRCFALISFFYLLSGLAYGQDLFGKWETQALPAQRTANQAVVLDLAIDADNRISGTVSEIGNAEPLTITSGTVTGWTFTFRTNRKLNGKTINENWNGVIADDNTLRVTRELAPQSTSVAPRRGPGFGIVPGDPPGPRNRWGDLIFHRPQAK